MAEVPTKPGHGAPPARNALEDTVQAEPSVEPVDGNAPVTSIPPAERYRLGVELGRGGMGRVVEAFDLQLGRTVALKEVLPRGGPVVARRFAREVQLTARLEHPSIVPLYDAGVTLDGRPFYVMRRVSGRPLDQLMAAAPELGERLALLPAVLAAIDAIAHAHRRGVIHRDVKPANILVGELGDTVVIDWGLAKVIDEDDDRSGAVLAMASDSLRTQMGSVFGTPGFMAPEQARGEELDPRGDVYALGATLYQLLAGAPPHAGTSATEVIARTGTHEVVPVDVVAPGAPPELVAIVGKALAFDPAGRYPDAGALGEDVRRFLAGQLVAAHRYTAGQRFARFARRHRAPLAVAALAMVAVAAVAWIGVHRIVVERDAADAARAAAAEGQSAAEKAGAEARRRAEQLIVMHARGLVDGNPTQAAAVLKELPGSSDRLGEARAVAQAAIMRGPAWAIQSSDVLTTIAELSADAKYLLQVTRDGVIQVWDLDRRRRVISRSYPPDTRALWVGRELLVTRSRSAPELFDPFADSSRAVPVAPIQLAVASDAGDRVAYLDGHGAAAVLEVVSRTSRPLWPDHVALDIAIASDGRWIAVADKHTVAVLDATGRELTRHPGPAIRLFVSRFDQLGYATADKVVLCSLAPQPTWTEIDLKPYLPARAVDFVFRGRELNLYLSPGKVLVWNGTRLGERLALTGYSPRMREADRDLLVIPGVDGKLHVINDLITAELHLPTPLQNLRLVARAGAPRVVAVGTGRIVGFDLAGSFPEPLAPRDVSATFVDDDTLLLWSQMGGTWRWYDVRTRAETTFSYDPVGLPQVVDVDPEDGRVLVHELANDELLVVVRRGTAEQRRLVHAPHVWGRLLPHGAMVFGGGDDRLFALTDAGPPRVIAKLEGIVQSAVPLGGAGFAALSSKGELVRGDLATGALTRAHVPPGTTWAFAGDRTGRVFVAQDDRLLLWDRDLVELARADRRIIRIEPCDDGALLELSDHAVVRAALVPGAPLRTLLAASSRSPLISPGGKLVIGESVNAQTVVFETQAQAAWELPRYFNWRELATISPTTRRFVQGGFGRLALWTLPLAPTELSRWLGERTNAVTDGDYALAWSWLPRP
jgi:hypothetical protein